MKYEIAWSAYGIVEVEADSRDLAIEEAAAKMSEIDLNSPQDVDGWDYRVESEKP